MRLLLAVSALLTVLAVPALAHEMKAPRGAEMLSAEHQDGGALNMALVGHTPLDWRGYNADVWVHEQHAYVGSWGFSDWNTGGEERFCPDQANSGVAVVDARNPASPRRVATLRQPSGTSVAAPISRRRPGARGSRAGKRHRPRTPAGAARRP